MPPASETFTVGWLELLVSEKAAVVATPVAEAVTT
jgi:hypothetical protein